MKWISVACLASFVTLGHAATYAYCIGVNDYPDGILHVLDEKGKPKSPDLKGAVADAKSWAERLKRFYGAEVTLLIDSTQTEVQIEDPKKKGKMVRSTARGATGAAFVKRLRDIYAKLKPGDTLIFTFSGHGIQLPYRMIGGSPQASIEEDKLEEYFVLKDPFFLHDDLVRQMGKALNAAGVNVTFIMDCCFAGGMSKPLRQGVELNFRSVKASPKAKVNSEKSLIQARDLRTAPTPGTMTFLMASSEGERAAEFTEPSTSNWHGAFTRALTQVLDGGPGTSLKSAMRDAGRLISRKWGIKQNPTSDGPAATLDGPLVKDAPRQSPLAPQGPTQPRKLALLIGESSYRRPIGLDGKPLKDEEGNPVLLDLFGPRNDVVRWKELLQLRGFEEDDIIALTDLGAKEFKQAIATFDSHLRPGDQAFFVYAGHGRQMPSKKEEDGFEEWLVLSDLSLVPDDDMSAWMNRLKDRGIQATFVYDSCYSGGMAKPLGKGEYVRSRSAPKIGVYAPVTHLELNAMFEPSPGGSILFLSASTKSQRALEKAFAVPNKRDTVVFGGFSFYLTKLLKDDRESPIRNCIRDINRIFKSKSFSQESTIEASSDNRENSPLFP